MNINKIGTSSCIVAPALAEQARSAGTRWRLAKPAHAMAAAYMAAAIPNVMCERLGMHHSVPYDLSGNALSQNGLSQNGYGRGAKNDIRHSALNMGRGGGGTRTTRTLGGNLYRVKRSYLGHYF